MFDEEDLVPLSALQHLLYCERQCALIHQEQTWADNRLTVEGTRMHRRSDEGQDELRGDLLIVRGLPLWSRRLGLSGKADVVEFRRAAEGEGASLEGRTGRWLPKPVEYKRGRPKRHRADEVQLCAQGLCLEEMFGTPVPGGDLFYGARKRRTEVALDLELRALTETLVKRLRLLLEQNAPPRAEYEPRKCDACSLISVCLPKSPRKTAGYVARMRES